ncbi:MAG: hypothetical protein RLZZ502_1418 [Pseudomonadota bacterium]|jgi:TatD DNase family protein
MWIDSHCHLDAPEFDADRDEVVAEARALGVEQFLNLPGHVAHFPAALASRDRYGFATGLGIHPLWVARSARTDIDFLRQQVAKHRPHCIGEIGLDFFVPDYAQTEQEWFYREQLKIARDFDLPVVLHVRRSQDRLLKHLREIKVKGGIAHAFNGSPEQAQQFVKLGFCLGFGGAATYPQALRIRHLLKTIPIEHLVLETDAPDIPPSFLGTPGSKKRNSPVYLPRIGSMLAELRGLAVEEFAAHCTQNVQRMLSLAQPLAFR